MSSLLRPVRVLFSIALVGWAAAPGAGAAMILEQYEFQGQPGTETTLNPSLVTSGLGGVAVAESSLLKGNAGTDSINATGWNNPGQFYSLGFTVNAGYTATVNQITLTSKSSNTGPGFINVNVSADGGPMLTVATINQSGGGYVDQILTIPAVTAIHSLMFYFTPANTTSANGGTTAGTGTFRIGDYNPPPSGSALTPFTLTGTVTPLGGPSAVPEPGSIALLGVGLGLAGIGARARSHRRAA